MKSCNSKILINSLRVLSVAAACILANAPRTSSAATIWNNGGPTDNGFEISSQATADDFVLTGPTTINGIQFWASQDGGNMATSGFFSGTVGWAIYDNNAGTPGTLLFSGSDNSVPLTLDGTNFDDPQYRLDVDVTPTVLGAGTYWLHLREGLIGSTDDGTEIFWSDSLSITGSTAVTDLDEVTPITWDDAERTVDLAFVLLGPDPIPPGSGGSGGIPEPSTLLLSAVGLLGLMRKRRRNS